MWRRVAWAVTFSLFFVTATVAIAAVDQRERPLDGLAIDLWKQSIGKEPIMAWGVGEGVVPLNAAEYDDRCSPTCCESCNAWRQKEGLLCQRFVSLNGRIGGFGDRIFRLRAVKISGDIARENLDFIPPPKFLCGPLSVVDPFRSKLPIARMDNDGLLNVQVSKFNSGRKLAHLYGIGGFHFVQLTLHYGQLPRKHNVLSDPHGRYDGSQQNSYSGSQDSFSSRPIAGAFMVILGSALLAFGFYSANSPNDPIRIPIFTWGIVAIGWLLVVQGGVLILIGRWLLQI